MAREITYLKFSALAGLSWEGSPLDAKSTALGVHWGTSFAPVRDRDHIGKPSLLGLLWASLPESARAQTILVGYADEAQELYFGAWIAAASPASEPEHLFESKDELVSWLANESTQSGIDLLLLNPALAETVRLEVKTERVGQQAENVMLPVVTGKQKSFEFRKRFDEAGNVQVALLAAGAAAVCFGVYALMTFVGSEDKTPTATVTKTVYLARDEAGFARGCAAQFAAHWTTGPGWVLEEEGCTSPSMASPAGLTVTEPTAYQIVSLRAGFDASIARAAMELVLAESDTELRPLGDKLLLTRSFGETWDELPTAVAAFTGDPARALELHYLGLARDVQAKGDASEITLWGTFTEALAPLEALPWVSLSEVKRKGGLVSVQVKQRTAIAKEIGVNS